jgi:ATP-dependent Clp protease ATP-binding subunit ClpX
MGYEKVDLKFTDEALRAIAKEALIRKTGARGLRGVIENAMLDVMYEIPSKSNVKECIIDDEVITKKKHPTLVYRTDDEMRALEAAEAAKSSKNGAGSAESA